MPTGPSGQKRPADVIANAVHVAKIATGEIGEAYVGLPPTVASNGASPPKRKPGRKIILDLSRSQPDQTGASRPSESS